MLCRSQPANLSPIYRALWRQLQNRPRFILLLQKVKFDSVLVKQATRTSFSRASLFAANWRAGSLAFNKLDKPQPFRGDHLCDPDSLYRLTASTRMVTTGRAGGCRQLCSEQSNKRVTRQQDDGDPTLSRGLMSFLRNCKRIKDPLSRVLSSNALKLVSTLPERPGRLAGKLAKRVPAPGSV